MVVLTLETADSPESIAEIPNYISDNFLVRDESEILWLQREEEEEESEEESEEQEESKEESQEDENHAEATFRYSVENVSKMTDAQLSPACYVHNLPWKILVMPRSNQTQEGQLERSLGFFLQCNGESESTSWSCYAVAELRLLSCKEGIEPFSKKIQHLFYSKEDDWGFRRFMTWEDVLDPDKGFIKDDSITLEVYVKADAPYGVN